MRSKTFADENKTVIKLKDVWKTYYMGNVALNVLKGVNIDINLGEFVVIIGPSGSGKCVTGDTLLVSENGSLIPIEKIKSGDKIFALNKKGKLTPFEFSRFHKRSVSNILELKTSSGKIIKLTPEHPLFTITSNGFEEILAKDCLGKFIATPRRIIFSGSSQCLNSFSWLKNDKSLVIYDSPEVVKELFGKLKISRKEICEKFKIKPNTYDYWLQGNNIKLFNLARIIEHYSANISSLKCFKLTALNSNVSVKIPTKTSPELLELLGFFVGDGNSDKTSIVITNIDEKLKNRVKILTKNLFGVDAKIYSKKVVCNSTVIKSFFNLVLKVPLKDKSRTIILPSFVFQCKLEEIAGFIRGLFDCDGFISKLKKEISITLASKVLILQLRHLFLRFGIHSRYSEVKKCATNTQNKIVRTYFKLSISGLDNLKTYSQQIGFNSENKALRLKNHLAKKGDTNVDVIPCGSLIKRIRQDSRIELTRTEHKVLWAYEKGKINPSIEKLNQIIKIFEKKKVECASLKNLIKMELFWDKVVSLRRINKKMQVYDLTVPKVDNFVANDFVIHNSTMMNQVGVLDTPTKGKIYLKGIDISTLSESDLAQLRGKTIGFVFQQFNLIPTLTALENVILPTIFQNVPENIRLKKATELLTMVGLGDRMHHKPTELSGGQQQRVAIARSLVNDPEIILADEPTGNLDSKAGKQVMEMLARLHTEEGKTVVLVTHDTDLVRYSQKTVYLKDGEVVKIQTNGVKR